MNVFRGFFSIVYKEVIQIRRDPTTLYFMMVIPLLQILIFGYAIDTTVRKIKTAVYNLDQGVKSRELIDSFVNTDYFKITEQAVSDSDLNQLIVTGKVKIGIKIPPDFSRNLLKKEPAQVLVLIDGSDSTVASQAVNAATSVGLKKSFEQIVLTNPSLRAHLPVDIRPKMLFNPDSKSANFMVPGLIAVILQMITTFLTALSIVREKERGTFEQLMVTPVRPLGLILGKLIPYCVIGFFEACSVLLAMGLIFHVPIHGSLLLLLLLITLFLFPALGIGLLISTQAANQMQAIQMTQLVLLPSIMLSGFIFPRESMPALLNWLGNFIPATYFIDIMRGIVLRGAHFMELWPDVLALTIMGIVILSISALRFKKTIP